MSEREFSGENSRASKGVKRAKGNRFCENTVRDFFGVVYWFMIFNVLWNSNIVKWPSKTGARGRRSSIGPNHDISVCSIYYLQFVCVGNSTLWLILQLGISFLNIWCIPLFNFGFANCISINLMHTNKLFCNSYYLFLCTLLRRIYKNIYQ